MMTYTQIILVIHQNRFIQSANIPQNRAFFEPFLQPTNQMQIIYIFVISDKQSFISEILKFVGPLTVDLAFFFGRRLDLNRGPFHKPYTAKMGLD